MRSTQRKNLALFVLSVAAIAVGAVLGLAPALIAKKLIDHLSAHSATFSYLALLVGVGLAASILNGIVNVGSSDTIFGSIRALITLGTTLAFMLVLDWRLTLIAMVALPLSVIPSRYIGRASYRARQRTQRKLAEMSV